MNEPLTTTQARAFLNAILAAGSRIDFAKHVEDAMAARKVSLAEILAVLKGGAVRPGEFENGSWRYQVRGGRLTVVIRFYSQTWIVCITTWRNR